MTMSTPPIDEAPHAAQSTAEDPAGRRHEGSGQKVLEQADGAPGRTDCAGQEGRRSQHSFSESVELMRRLVEEFPPLWQGEKGVIGGDEFGEGGEGG